MIESSSVGGIVVLSVYCKSLSSSLDSGEVISCCYFHKFSLLICHLLVITIDQLKALKDKVSHQYLFKTLKSFCFGPSFIKWIQTIYNSTSSSVKPNSWMTAFVINYVIMTSQCLRCTSKL